MGSAKRRSSLFRVEAHDAEDGERYLVTDTCWDGDALCFNRLIPSNGHRVRHRMRAQRARRGAEG